MSVLPIMGSLMATQDTNKQLSSIRSYLSQLQESMEAELMNIGIDNLSGELKKKLETMSDDIMVQSNEVQDLQTSLVTAEQVSAIVGRFNFVTTSVLNARLITVNNLIAEKATIGDLTAVSARVGTIEANYVNANFVNTAILNSGFIKADYITGNLIRGKIFGSDSANIDWINATNIKLTSGVVMNAAGADRVFSPVSMNGYYVLATPQPRATTQLVE